MFYTCFKKNPRAALFTSGLVVNTSKSGPSTRWLPLFFMEQPRYWKNILTGQDRSCDQTLVRGEGLKFGLASGWEMPTCCLSVNPYIQHICICIYIYVYTLMYILNINVHTCIRAPINTSEDALHVHMHYMYTCMHTCTLAYKIIQVTGCVFLDSPAHPANCFRCLKFESMGRVRNTYFFNTSTFKGVPYMVPLQGVNSPFFRVKNWHRPRLEGAWYIYLSMDPSNWPREAVQSYTQSMKHHLSRSNGGDFTRGGMAGFLIDALVWWMKSDKNPTGWIKDFLKVKGGCDSHIF